jgi:membrane protease YdiL (CAAX protease family)
MSEQAHVLPAPAEHPRRLERAGQDALWGSLSAVAAAQIATAYAGPTAASLANGAVLVLLLVGYVAGAGPRAQLYGALSLVPLATLIGLAVPVDDTIAALGVGGALTLLAVVLAARAVDLLRPVGAWGRPRVSAWSFAAVIAGAGITALIDPAPIVPGRSAATLAAGALTVFACSGVVEELVFRGAVQAALTRLIGDRAVIWTNLLFVTTYAGSGSVAYLLLIAAVGHTCGTMVRRTGRVGDAALLHGTLAASVLVLWPAVL